MDPARVPADIDRLGDEIAETAAHLDAATHRLLTCIREFDLREGWARQGARDCAAWLSWRIGLDRATAREKVRVARALGALPRIDDALRRGVLSYAKVRALTRVATPAIEERLLDMAVSATGAQLERICRGYRHATAEDEPASAEATRWIRHQVLDNGMVRIEAVLQPDEAKLVLAAIDKARDRIAAAQAPATQEEPAPSRPSRADGLVAVAEGSLSGDPGAGRGAAAEILVHLEQDALAPDGTLGATLEDGTRVSAETLRRLACDGGVVPVTVDEKCKPLDVGRRTRTIPPAIRRALLARDRHCRFPGCTSAIFLHGHHVEHWLHGGATSLGNLLLLCSFHHRLVHEGGFDVSRDAAGDFVFRSPDARGLAAAPPPRVPADAFATLAGAARAAGLTIDSDTNLSGWQGDRVDYDAAVAALC